MLGSVSELQLCNFGSVFSFLFTYLSKVEETREDLKYAENNKNTEKIGHCGCGSGTTK